MRKLSLTVIALSLTVFLGFFSPAFAQTVVVPNSLENTEGNINTITPYGCGEVGFPSFRSQQVYLGSQFPQAGFIDKISYRLDRNFDSGFGPIIVPNVLIELSTTQAQPNALSSTFADNVGPDVQAVFTGDLTLSAPNCNIEPCPFDIMIPLQNPFFYDPQEGNLLLDVRIPVCVDFGAGNTTRLDDTNQFPTITSHVNATNVDFDEGQQIGGGPVTQFRIAEPPAAPIATDIPTISEWGLIAMAGILGIVGFLVIRRKKATT